MRLGRARKEVEGAYEHGTGSKPYTGEAIGEESEGRRYNTCVL